MTEHDTQTPLCDICQLIHRDVTATHIVTWRDETPRYYCDNHNRLVTLLAKSWMLQNSQPITSQS